MITTSTPARWQASSIRAWRSEKFSLRVAKQRAVVAEEGPVEVGVHAAKRHGRAPYMAAQASAATKLGAVTRWRLADRVLEFPPPLAAGIVNVTDDSFFEGARSGTPERAIQDGLALVAAGLRPARRRRRAGAGGRARARRRRRRRGSFRRSRAWSARPACRSAPTRSTPRWRRGRWTPGRWRSTTSRAGPTRAARGGRPARLRLCPHAHRGPAARRPRAARATTTRSPT